MFRPKLLSPWIVLAAASLSTPAVAQTAPAAAQAPAGGTPREVPSSGLYRLPYADGIRIEVFDDARSHRPEGRVDLFAVSGKRPRAIVAAAPGRIVAIRDGYAEQQSGRKASDCRNNYVWIAHANGEWTGYSHMAQDSATGKARLQVGDMVEAGQYLGDEAAVGCAMLEHLHFEVATPGSAIDENGFLLENEGGTRNRNPHFCGVPTGFAVKGASYVAAPCPDR